MNEPRILGVGEEPPALTPRNGTPPTSTRDKASKPKGKPGDRFAVLNSFVDFTLAGLSRAESATWLILWRDTRDGTARTSMADIARRAGCTRRAVVDAMAKLEAVGLVKVVHRGGFRQGPSRYRLRPLVK